MFIVGGSDPLSNLQYHWMSEVSLRPSSKQRLALIPASLRGKGTMELCEDKNNRDYFWSTVSPDFKHIS